MSNIEDFFIDILTIRMIFSKNDTGKKKPSQSMLTSFEKKKISENKGDLLS